ncbi:oxidoreductase [Thozetella sp. PMI_491]|nr:oxidoreductase [Thozetella sp. PMI_491]
MMGSIKVGIIGYGNSAKNFHLPFIQNIPEYELVAILQRSAAPSNPDATPKGVHCTVDFPAARHFRTVEKFFAEPCINLVVIATTNSSHAPLAKMALNAGRHVVIDKPFAQSTEEAEELIQLADGKGLLITCFQNRRWDGDFQTLRELATKGALGKIKEAELHYDFESAGSWFPMTEGPYEPGRGMTYALGTHSIDQAVALFGRPKCVTAFFRAQRGVESEIEDSFTIILQYGGLQSDLLVTIKSCITTIMSQQLKYIVRGTKGSYFKTQQRSTCVQEEQIAKNISPTEPGFGVESDLFCGVLTTSEAYDNRHQKYDEHTQKYYGRYPTVPGRWLAFYENVAAAIKGTGELEVKATHVRDVLRIIELARVSHTQNCTVQWD